MRAQRTTRGASALLVLIAFVAACQPAAPAAPLLDDPREVLTRGFDVTSALRTVHLRAEATMRTAFPGQPMPDQQQMSLDVDIDFTTGNLAASGLSGNAGERIGIILLDGTMFNLNGSTGRWTQTPNMGGMPGILGMGLFGMGGAQGPDVKALLRGVVADERVTKELISVDPCAGVQCYRVRITLPPEVLWETVMDLMGMGNGGIAGGLGEMPPGIPPLSTELLFETSTLMLIESRVAVSMEGNELSASLQLSAHDLPIAIQPPPPQLVDRFDQGFFPVP